MKPNTDNSSLKKIITASIVLKPEKVADFLEIVLPMIKSSNAEPGCESYMFYQDPFDKTKFMAVEFWKDQPAIDSHNNSVHFKAFIEKIGGWVSSPPEIKVHDLVSK